MSNIKEKTIESSLKGVQTLKEKKGMIPSMHGGF